MIIGPCFKPPSPPTLKINSADESKDVLNTAMSAECTDDDKPV